MARLPVRLTPGAAARGGQSRLKMIEVEGLDSADLRTRLTDPQCFHL